MRKKGGTASRLQRIPWSNPLHRSINPLLQDHFLILSQLLTVFQTLVLVFIGSVAIDTRALKHQEASSQRTDMKRLYIFQELSVCQEGT
jgi:hypothetical protein